MSEENEMQVIGTPDRSIPKFATNVIYAKLPNGDLVMSFLVRSGQNTQSALIETIMIDAEHAKRMAEKLTEITINDK